MENLLESLQLAGLAVVSVALWTLRVALTARSRRVAGSLIAGLEAVVFVVAFSRVSADVAALHKLLGYALGVAAGTLLGVFIDERLSAGQSEVRLVTEGRDRSHIAELQAAGWPVTWMSGEGPNGDVTVAFVAVDDMRIQALVKSLRDLVPEGFWTVERLKSARAGGHNPSWLQVGQSGLRFTHAHR